LSRCTIFVRGSSVPPNYLIMDGPLSPSVSSSPSGVPLTFERLFCEYFKHVMRSVQWMGVPARNAPDVTQDVFIAVHRALPRYDPSRPLLPWLNAIIYRTARDYLQLQRHARELLVGESDDRVDPISDAAERRLVMDDAAVIVTKLLQDLDEERRQVFVMHELHEMPIEDIANSLHLPETTIRSWMRRARKEFDAALRRWDAAEEHKFGRTRFVPLLDPTALVAAVRTLPDVAPEMVAQIRRRVVQASASGAGGLSPGLVLTPVQSAVSIAGLLLGGAISGAAVTHALDHQSSVAPEVAIRAELPPPLSTGITASVPPSLGSVSVPVASSHSIRAPAAGGARPKTSTVQAELFIIERARRAADQGRWEDALESLKRHAQQFPLGLMTADRETLRRAIEARRNASPP
jgi:RNA polymerase sigma factor (sigma-70 family)